MPWLHCRLAMAEAVCLYTVQPVDVATALGPIAYPQAVYNNGISASAARQE